jgi:hypothetical protein
MGEELARLILTLRGQRVLLAGDLARLYGVEARALVQAVKRNRSRFPADFCFQLTADEGANLKSQSVISSWGGSRSAPYAFTEQGVAMLSSVLRSRRAIEANIAIMRAFVALRALAAQNKDILKKLTALESRVDRNDADIGALIDAIRERVTPEPSPRRRIGFQAPG